MKSKFFVSGIAAIFSFLSTGYGDEAVVEDGSLIIAESAPADMLNDSSTTQDDVIAQSEIAWGFTSKKRASRAELANQSVTSEMNETPKAEQAVPENYNDITSCGAWVTAEFLYWKPSVSGVPIGLKSTTASFALDNNIVNTNGKEHQISYDFHPGFKAGLGYRLPYDQWDIYAQWTQLHAQGRKGLTPSNEKIVETIWTTITPVGNPSRLTAKGNIHLRVADLELGKVFYISRPFSLRSSIGARGAFIDQGMKLNYSNVASSQLSFTGNDHLHLKNKYQAGGLRGALAAYWNFKCGWTLFGKTGLSLLWGRFQSSIHENLTGLNTSPSETYKQINKTNLMKSVFDVASGISWTKVFSSKMRLSLYSTYEFNFWPNQVDISQYTKTGQLGALYLLKSKGDLGFQGFNVGGRFDF